MIHPVKYGRNVRMSYSRINEILDVPNLIEVQKKSYNYFLEEGLREVFRDISPIMDFSENLMLDFVDYKLDENPKYSVEECKERDATYSAPLRAKVRLTNRETGEIKEQEIFMGDFPLMTENGTFIINGAERVIVSQLVRSPGVYYTYDHDKTGKKLYTNQVIPNRGAWLEYETDSNDIMYVRIDRTRKLPITVLVRALGYSSDQQIIDLFGEEEMITATLSKDNSHDTDEGLIEVYKRLRPGEPPNVENAKNLINLLFFDPKRYDLARFGRFKFNKKLALAHRITGHYAAEDIINTQTGEVIVIEGEMIDENAAWSIQDSGINEVHVNVNNRVVKVIGNNTVDIKKYCGLDTEELDITERVSRPVIDDILESAESDELRIEAIKSNLDKLIPKHITVDDIIASINYMICISHDVGSTDDIDHLGNRRLRSVGELLQNQFRIGLTRLERVVRERMNVQDMDIITPQALINIRPVAAAIKEFFGSSQLSQFMDQPNPLAELTHKRRLSALGPGGLSRERAGFEVRDVHYSHYGRICPIETPEGPNIGLIGSLSTYARVNNYGFIEAPYRRVDREKGVTNEVVYLTADEEEKYFVAQSTEPIDENGNFINKKISVRKREDFIEVDPSMVDYMDVSPKQLVSVATSLIPFLENDDANRALMGSNMQRQAVPLVRTEAPIIGTGMEFKTALDSGVVVIANNTGIVEKISANKIIIRNKSGQLDEYPLLKYKRSNQGTCINQKVLVRKGDAVEKGDIIADGPSTSNGEISLGRNVLVGFMTWEGYNYEDAILISERLVKEDVYTSIHIEKYELEARDTKLGPEEITRDIPNVGEDALKDLDESGIIRIGAEIQAGDVLVGKVTPKGETELTAEERLLRAIFGEKAREVRDTSLKVPHGESGIVVDVKVFSRENGDELSPGVNQLVRVYVAQKRKISVGDKMAGRHGNKGVISMILPEEDMPYMPDGTPLDIVLNPLGVPSRMNIGQVLEVHLGYAAKALGWEIASPVFDGAEEEDIEEALIKAGLPKDGKIMLRDGRSGEPFDNPVTVGYMYMLKLMHLVDDKIHARSTGPYSLVTQQPLGGKAQFGGQRFGEMEVWALEAYGAAYTLQEILTVKSDDTVGRVKTYEAIVKGENIPEPGIPESFKVLVKELQSLALDVRVYSDNKSELNIKDYEETDNKEDAEGKSSSPTKFDVEEDEDSLFIEELIAEENEGFDDLDDEDIGEVSGDIQLVDNLDEDIFGEEEAENVISVDD